jgi:enamine deaminase RidA (YjgF/YER057c/UK114 family)
MNERELEAGLPQTPGYRYAKRNGNQLYVAGQVPNDATGSIVSEDTFSQAKQCLENLETILWCYEFSTDDIQHITIYVVGEQRNLVEAWRAVSERFANEVPPATLLGVARLGYPSQTVEIDATIFKESA